MGKEGRHLKEEDLNALQMKMMQSNTVPRLLPVKVDEMDLQLRLHYDLSSKRMLTPYLREKRLSWNDFAHLFIHIIEAIEASSLYMLNHNQFVLERDFIFIGRDVGDVYLTYLPMKELDREGDISDDLRSLLNELLEEYEHLQGEKQEEVSQYVASPSYNLQGLKELLMSMSVYHAFDEARAQESNHPLQDASMKDGEPMKPEDMNEVHTDRDKKEKGKKEASNVSDREKVYLFAGSALAIALFWKVYQSTGTSLWFYISTISTILIPILDGSYLAWRKGIFQRSKKTKNPKKPSKLQNEEELSVPTIRETKSVSDERVEEEFQTNPLGEENGGSYAYQSIKGDIVPFLTVRRNNETESVNINHDHFVIGRHHEMVHHVEDVEGVSRVHAEFTKVGDHYGVKDLGSKNGTYVNESLLIPYKVYELKDNDKVIIGNSTLTFHHPEPAHV